MRLTEDRGHLGHERRVSEHGQLNNSMLREYIRSIYDDYGIEDPIERELRLAKRNLSNSNGSP